MAYERPLSAEEMRRTLEIIIKGVMPPEEIAEFLKGMAARGESADEIATAVEVFRKHAVPLPISEPLPLLDTCGTGGDGQGTINVSTLAGLVAAAAGAKVAKHGNRAASSKCGSADLLEALGVKIDASPKQVAACIEKLGFGFCFAPAFHPAMKIVAPVRKMLGIRTIFNLVGPLANPAALQYQLVGVSDLRLLQPMSDALYKLNRRHAMVVFGKDGLDEISITGPTAYVELKQGKLTTGTLTPEKLGVPQVPMDALRGGDAARNAGIALQVLGGAASPYADVVAVNAGCALYLADQAPDIAAGIVKAREALQNGAATRLLENLKRMSHAPG